MDFFDFYSTQSSIITSSSQLPSLDENGKVKLSLTKFTSAARTTDGTLEEEDVIIFIVEAKSLNNLIVVVVHACLKLTGELAESPFKDLASDRAEHARSLARSRRRRRR